MVAVACLALAAGVAIQAQGVRPSILFQSVGPAVRLVTGTPGEAQPGPGQGEQGAARSSPSVVTRASFIVAGSQPQAAAPTVAPAPDVAAPGTSVDGGLDVAPREVASGDPETVAGGSARAKAVTGRSGKDKAGGRSGKAESGGVRGSQGRARPRQIRARRRVVGPRVRSRGRQDHAQGDDREESREGGHQVQGSQEAQEAREAREARAREGQEGRLRPPDGGRTRTGRRRRRRRRGGRSRLLLQAAETINSSLDSGALETTILGEAARLTGAGAAALLVPRGDVLVAREALGIGDRSRDSFVVPLETSVFGRALVSGEIVVDELEEAEAGDAEAPRRTRRRPTGGGAR